MISQHPRWRWQPSSRVSVSLPGAAESSPSLGFNMSPKNVVFKKICKDKSVSEESQMIQHHPHTFLLLITAGVHSGTRSEHKICNSDYVMWQEKKKKSRTHIILSPCRAVRTWWQQRCRPPLSITGAMTSAMTGGVGLSTISTEHRSAERKRNYFDWLSTKRDEDPLVSV